MGPYHLHSVTSVPIRPRFSLDIKNVTWTDGHGDQEDVAKDFKIWRAFIICILRAIQANFEH